MSSAIGCDDSANTRTHVCVINRILVQEHHSVHALGCGRHTCFCLSICSFLFVSLAVCLSDTTVVSACDKQGHRFKKIVLAIYLVVVIILGVIMVIAVAVG